MKRWIPIMTLAAGLVLVLVAVSTAFAQEGGNGHDEFAALRGAALFAEYCQACHGPQGEARGTGAAFAAIDYTSDTGAETRELILKGHGEVMPGLAGRLDTGQVTDLLAYLATWESGEVPPLPEPNIAAHVAQVADYFGDPQAGAEVYAKFCYGCHGPEGEGRGDEGFPAVEFTGDSRRVVAQDHRPAFGQGAGGPLGEQQLIDLETYMASWQAAGPEAEDESQGLSVLIVLVGLGTIVLVGLAYMTHRVYIK